MDISNPKQWTVRQITDLADSASQWDRLNREGRRTPILDSDFVIPLIENFSGGPLYLAVLGEEGEPDAMTLLERRGSGRWALFQPSQAPIGLWVSRPGRGPADTAGGLLGALPGLALLLDVTQLDPEFDPRPADGGALHAMDYIPTSRIRVEGGYDEFWSGRSRNTRQNLKRQRNRLGREGIEPRLEEITDGGEMEGVIRDYGMLESGGWKGEQGTAVALDNAQGRFYLGMMRRFAERGKAVAYRYWYNDVLAAMDLCIHDAGTMVILKTAYNESLKASSPGMLMHQEIFQRIFERRLVDVIEFYGRTLDWHRKWTRDERSLYHLSVYRHPLLRSLHRDLLGRVRRSGRKAASEAEK